MLILLLRKDVTQFLPVLLWLKLSAVRLTVLHVVSWSLTSLFSINTAISETMLHVQCKIFQLLLKCRVMY